MDDLKLYQIFLIFRWNSGGIMPKKRKQPGTRNFEKCIFILCEGSDKHSEYAYFTSLLRDYPMKGNRVQISLVPTEKNTGKELVLEAAEKLKSEYKNIDEAWVVYDQDGYTKHAETFCIAKDNGVKIAFSATAFEYWILLHFEYTTAFFPKSEDIIKYMKKEKYIDYAKKDGDVYNRIADKLEFAKDNARKLRKDKEKTDFGKPVYELNPYTDVDVLISEIQEESQK